MIYIIIIILLFASSIISLFKRNFSNLNIYYFLILILFFFSAFRYQVGCDWDGYIHSYLNSSGINLSDIINLRDPIYYTILFFMHKFDIPQPFVNIITSAIFFIGINSLAKRQPNPLIFLSLLFPILIMNMPMSGIRQAAAIGFICLAFVSFIDRNALRFGVYVLLASGFHSSAIIFLLMIPFVTSRFNLSLIIILLIFSLFLLLLFPFSEVISVINRLYIVKNQEAHGAIYRISYLFLSAIFFFLFIKKKWLKYFPIDYNLVKIGSIGILLLIVLIPISSVIADRFGYYFILIQTIIFARLYYLPFNSGHLFYSLIPYFASFLIFFVWVNTSYHFQACYIPYDTWIFGFPENNIPEPGMLEGEHFR